ncbi:peptidase inhibitor family I36 protein [Streptomyces griseoluteus]|uniref:peptidase inhibitor family I36 protein n=1 Tax=Streptomyces griseoluteus TaxID=29306 RepID=UPI00381B3FF8
MAPSASAAYECGDGQVCIYKNSDFTGSVYVVPKVTLSNGLKAACARDLSTSRYTDGSVVDNTASSIVNNSDSVIFLSEYKNGGGKYTGVSGGRRLWNLDSVQTFDSAGHQTYESFNDRASSAC